MLIFPSLFKVLYHDHSYEPLLGKREACYFRDSQSNPTSLLSAPWKTAKSSQRTPSGGGGEELSSSKHHWKIFVLSTH